MDQVKQFVKQFEDAEWETFSEDMRNMLVHLNPKYYNDDFVFEGYVAQFKIEGNMPQ